MLPNVSQTGNILRGCRYRKKGYTYAISRPPEELDLDPFLLCYPWRPWENTPEEIGISAQGMRILERQNPDGTMSGIWDLYDWVGSSDYEYFPFFWTEACYYGTSRLIPVTTPFKLLSNQSRHLFLHEKAIILNPDAFYMDRLHLKDCPSQEEQVREAHDHPDMNMGYFSHCTGLLWEAIGTTKKPVERTSRIDLPFNRKKDETPTCSFLGATIPHGTIVEWQSAVIAWTPIEGFEIVVDTESDRHEKALKLLQDSGTDIPYTFVED